jgi:type I restriction enzyme S subunit
MVDWVNPTQTSEVLETSEVLSQPNDFKETEIGPIPADWEVVLLGRATKHKKVSINPQSYPDEIFDYYSIPAYQVSDEPVPEHGSEILSQKLVVESGTVLFGKLNPRVPKVWRVISSSLRRKIASTEFIPLVAIEGKTSSEFLYYLAWSDYVLPKSQELVSGSTPSRQRVDVKAFLSIPIPLPPLPEQRRIAHVLNTIQREIAVQDALIEAARQVKRSLMARLFTYGPGAEPALTKETEIGEVPEHWEVVRFKDVMQEQIQNGAFVKREQFGEGVPFLNVADTYKSTVVNLRTLERVRCSEEELEKFGLQTGDLIFVRSSLKREGVGQCILVEEVEEPAIYDCHLMRVKPDMSTVLPKFLTYYSLSPRGKDALIARSKTTTMTTINQSGLASVSVPLPPLREQQDIAQSMEVVEGKIAAEEQRKAALGALFKSMLSQLMTGQIRLKDVEL